MMHLVGQAHRRRTQNLTPAPAPPGHRISGPSGRAAGQDALTRRTAGIAAIWHWPKPTQQPAPQYRRRTQSPWPPAMPGKTCMVIGWTAQPDFKPFGNAPGHRELLR